MSYVLDIVLTAFFGSEMSALGTEGASIECSQHTVQPLYAIAYKYTLAQAQRLYPPQEYKRRSIFKTASCALLCAACKPLIQ